MDYIVKQAAEKMKKEKEYIKFIEMELDSKKQYKDYKEWANDNLNPKDYGE